MVHPTTVKLTIDQLEAGGLVERRPHPKDRRTTLVQLTGEGLVCVQAVNKAISEAEHGMLAGLRPHYEDLSHALQRARLGAGDTGPEIDADLGLAGTGEPYGDAPYDVRPGRV